MTAFIRTAVVARDGMTSAVSQAQALVLAIKASIFRA